jgi:hypothetical protein
VPVRPQVGHLESEHTSRPNLCDQTRSLRSICARCVRECRRLRVVVAASPAARLEAARRGVWISFKNGPPERARPRFSIRELRELAAPGARPLQMIENEGEIVPFGGANAPTRHAIAHIDPALPFWLARLPGHKLKFNSLLLSRQSSSALPARGRRARASRLCMARINLWCPQNGRLRRRRKATIIGVCGVRGRCRPGRPAGQPTALATGFGPLAN